MYLCIISICVCIVFIYVVGYLFVYLSIFICIYIYIHIISHQLFLERPLWLLLLRAITPRPNLLPASAKSRFWYSAMVKLSVPNMVNICHMKNVHPFPLYIFEFFNCCTCSPCSPVVLPSAMQNASECIGMHQNALDLFMTFHDYARAIMLLDGYGI